MSIWHCAKFELFQTRLKTSAFCSIQFVSINEMRVWDYEEHLRNFQNKAIVFFFYLHLVAFIELMKNECRCISSQTDVWNVGSLYYFTFLPEVKTNYKQTGKYQQMLTEKAGLDGRGGIKNRWVNEQNDLGGSQALCIWQFVLRDRRKHSDVAARAICESFS